MRTFLLVILLIFYMQPAFCSDRTDSLINVLKMEISKKKVYDDRKEVRIRTFRQKLAVTAKTDLDHQYNWCKHLYEEYKVYQFDSAYVYSQKLISISNLKKDAAKQYDSKIKLAFILVSSGMFKETFDVLNQIDTHKLNDSLKTAYYDITARSFSDLENYNNDKNYGRYDKQQSLKYLDSAILSAEPGSLEQLMNQGNKQIALGQLLKPSPYFIKLLDHFQITEHQRAIAATGLSSFFEGPYQIKTRTNLLAIGAINDIRSSTKETLAIFKLGQLLYTQDNVSDAYLFLQQAMDDAQYYGARLRTIKIAAELPIVAARVIIVAEKQKDRFLVYLISIAGISLLTALISFIVFIQLKRLKTKEKTIQEKNILLEKINDKLLEEARIKEDYIGYFFNLISGYILKLEKIKRNVERKITTKKYDEALQTVAEIDIKKEREALFNTFDHVFIKIFPNFIDAFNALFDEADQIWPKEHEIMNTDLRIFALMRLGINDTETIADILKYSVNTIYVYKMRIKARAHISSEQFDKRIMAIKSVDALNKA